MATVESEQSEPEFELEYRESESERVIGWRAEKLLGAGFDDGTALELALLPHVDLHAAIRLVRTGCPAATAVRILA
jgi:hypothetical protein